MDGSVNRTIESESGHTATHYNLFPASAEFEHQVDTGNHCDQENTVQSEPKEIEEAAVHSVGNEAGNNTSSGGHLQSMSAGLELEVDTENHDGNAAHNSWGRGKSDNKYLNLKEKREMEFEDDMESDVDNYQENNTLMDVKVKEDVDSDGNMEKSPELFVTFERQAKSNNSSVESDDLNHVNFEKEAEIDSSNNTDAVDKVVIKCDANSDSEVEKNAEFDLSFQKGVKAKIERKQKRNPYSNHSQKRYNPNCLQMEMMKHPLLPPCQCNKRKCGEQFSHEARNLIHDKFWTMDMYERREWINEHLLYLKPKSRTNNPVSTLHESHRKFYLPNLSGKIDVCRKMFFSTLGFKDEAKFLQNPNHLNKKGMLSKTRKRKCVLSRKHWHAVEEYCKELTERHGSSESPGTSSQVVIPSGFSLRDMFNDFCTKNSTSTFGYHRFRHILELILRGERIEDSQFADLRDDLDDEDDGLGSAKQKKVTSDKPDVPRKRKQYNKKIKHHLPKKKRTVLKLPSFSEIKANRINKVKRMEIFPNSSTNNRYNFRESISVLKTYCEDDLMESELHPEIETYEDLINTHVEDDRKKKDVQPLKSKQESSSSAIKKRAKKVKKLSDPTKPIKPRKKKKKSALREAQIEFAESRKKSGVNHPVLPPCKCNFRKCSEKIQEDQRQVIHDEFWRMFTKQEKKKWIQKHIMHCKPRSRSNFIKFPRKHLSKKYFFPTREGKMVGVCRVFFMRTLGYHSNMTIESIDMSEELDLNSQNNELSYQMKANDDGGKHSDSNSKGESPSSSQTGSKEISGKVNDNNDKSICKEEDGSQLDEQEDVDGLLGPKTMEARQVVFFTPDIEKAEVEKASNPATRRRRPLSLRNSKEHHPMGEPCHCAKKCPDKIAHDRRFAIHEHYWSLVTYNQRKQWILEHIKRDIPKRRTVLTSPVRKKETRKCYLPNWDDSKVEVCRGFFLSTLGFKWDKMIDTICKTTPQDSKYVRADQRGKRAPVHKLSDNVLDCMREYLESILQTIPYVPPQPRDPQKPGSKKKKTKNPAPKQSGLTIKTLYADYKAKHPNQKVSYASFRKIHCEVRDMFKAQDEGFEEEQRVNVQTSSRIPDSHHSDISASPGSDNGFMYESNNVPPDPRRMNPNSTITPLQSCMYNDQPQLLNLSHPDSAAKHSNHNEGNRFGPGGIKFSKAQDFHLLPFPSYEKASTKGHNMYQLPGHSSTNIMPQYSSGQNNPLDPFYMASSSQAMANPMAYSNLHFPTDLINHPHLHHHHPAHHHPHLYQSTLPYRDHHNKFPGSVLPQALKEHDHNHHFYSPQMDFGQDHHHHTGAENNIYPFKDALNYPSFTPDNVTHSPVQNQIQNQLSYPTSNVNMLEQRNGNPNQVLNVGSFDNPSNSNTCSAPNMKVSENQPVEYLSEGTSGGLVNKSVKDEQMVKKKHSRKRKKNDETPKVKRIRKVRPLSNRNSKEHHPMLPPCTCGKKCFEKFSQSRREDIYNAFWELGTYNNRKQWIAEHMKREDPKRRTNLEAPVMRKKETRRFVLPNAEDEKIEVCRLFFLHTLGLKWDKIIGTICKTTARDEHVVPPDMRGRKPPAHKLNDEVSRSVESYARALVQAAKPEYLANLQQPDNPKKFTLDTFIPYGLTMKNLHQDYKAKHASHKVSYESFRKIFRQVRKNVLDPDSADVEEKEDVSIETNSASSETMQGTINAATGHIDATF